MQLQSYLKAIHTAATLTSATLRSLGGITGCEHVLGDDCHQVRQHNVSRQHFLGKLEQILRLSHNGLPAFLARPQLNEPSQEVFNLVHQGLGKGGK